MGTSAGWPLPRLGCNCNICASDDSKDSRLRPSILINDEVLIDVPPDIYQEITRLKINTSKIKFLFITHTHDDHIVGLFDLSHIYNQPEKITLFATRSQIAALQNKLRMSLRSLKIREVRPLEKINLESESFATLIPVDHGSIESYGIKFKSPKPIFYAPEFRKILPSSKKAIGDLDLAIIDGSSQTSFGQAKNHQTIEEGLRLGKEIKAKKVLFTNIGHKTDTHVNLCKFVKKEGGDKFAISYDGLEIKL